MLNTRHRRAARKQLKVVHRLEKVIPLPVELQTETAITSEDTRTTESPRCVEKRLGSRC